MAGAGLVCCHLLSLSLTWNGGGHGGGWASDGGDMATWIVVVDDLSCWVTG